MGRTVPNWASKAGMTRYHVVYHQVLKPESKEKVHEPRHHAVITAMRQALGAREAACSTKLRQHLAHMKNYTL